MWKTLKNKILIINKVLIINSHLIEKKMTQKELSRISEVAEYKISQLASGTISNIYLTTAKKICEVLGVTLDDAFGDVI